MTDKQKLQNIVSELKELPKTIKANCAGCGNEFNVETEVIEKIDGKQAWYKQKTIICSKECSKQLIKDLERGELEYHKNYKNNLITKSIYK